MGVRFIVGDTRHAVQELDDSSVDLILGSPPFLGLRSYLPADHPLKHLELGAESTPADYLDMMLELTEGWAPKLAPHGSICIEIGDSYAGSGGAGGDYTDDGLRAGQQRFDGSAAKARRLDAGDKRQRARQVAKERGKPDGGSWSNRALAEELGIRPRSSHWRGRRDGWPLDKSLVGIPTLYSWSLAYGRNLLREPMSAHAALGMVDGLRNYGMTAEAALALVGGYVAEHGEQRLFDPWRVRNLIVWARPNPPVGSLGDKIRPSTSYLTVACKSEHRWFDLDAVRHHNPRATETSRTRASLNRSAPGYHTGEDDSNADQNPLGAPPLDHWVVSPSQFRGAHFATWPEQLCIIPIESMCPRRVCLTCGQPSERIVQAKPSPFNDIDDVVERRRNGRNKQPLGIGSIGIAHGDESREAVTIGWTTCGCPGTDEMWADGWNDVYAEVQLVLRKSRKRGTSRAERAEIHETVLPPLYAKLRAMYLGRQDGFHLGDGWRPGVVLDPWGGSGTTGSVASALGRDCILIDIDERNVDFALPRIGLFMDGVEHRQVADY